MTQGKYDDHNDRKASARAGRPTDIKATGPFFFLRRTLGEYGAGDRFLGIRVPVLRKLAKQYGEL